MLQTGEDRSDTGHEETKEILELLFQADIVKFVHFLVDVINVLGILSHVSQNRNSSIADVFATLESTLEMLRMYQTRWGERDDLRDLGNHLPGTFSCNGLLEGSCFSPDQGPKNVGWIQSHTFTVTASKERETLLMWDTWFWHVSSRGWEAVSEMPAKMWWRQQWLEALNCGLQR